MITALPGLTNFVYREGAAVIRHGRPFAQALGVNRTAEMTALRQIRDRDIGPALLLAETARDYAVFGRIDGAPLSDRVDTAAVHGALRTLARLHQLPGSGAPFSAQALMECYLTIAQPTPVLRSRFESFARCAGRLEQTRILVLCHNDCAAKNWLRGADGGMRLVDFEFAAPNDPAFDLATWCLASGLAPEDPRMAWYGPFNAARTRAYLPIVDALWSLYCLAMEKLLSPGSCDAARVEVAEQFRLRMGRLERGYRDC
jgi:aminoglycoside phosphotransferase (APT) family kinase protein